jgi:hypothetical protein
MQVFAVVVALCAIGTLAGRFVLRDGDHWRDGDPRHASRGALRGALVALAASGIVIGICICGAVSAHARPSPYPPVTQYDGDRISARQAQMGADVVRAVRIKRARYSHPARKRPPVSRKGWRHVPMPAPRTLAYEPYKVEAPASRPVAVQIIGGRPSGCPFRFCGCGASLRLFGRIIPALNLAANWLRFPRAAPAPGMAAARRGHVFVLERHIAGRVWLVHDSNSGGHRTRIHPRSIAGYTIVNPRSSS